MVNIEFHLHICSNAAVRFGKKLFPLFAIALDLPEDWFGDKVRAAYLNGAAMSLRYKTRESAAIMRILHYPPQTGPHDDRILGIGAHTE